MDKISEMIKQMCPDGVDTFQLGDISDIIRGKRVTKGQLLPNGLYPVISGGVTPMGYINEYNREANTITVSQYGTAGYVDFQKDKFWANDICYCVYPVDKLDNRYLWYVLKGKQDFLYAIRNTDATPFSMPFETLKGVEIPLPPLPIQQEIVRILDSFTSMITNLETELASRQKQYEYYRNKLLTFDENDETVEWKTLGEVCNISRGKRVVRKDLAEFGDIPVYQNSLKPLGYADDSNYPANTPFIISAGAAGEVGFSFTEYWGADDCFSILCNEKINSRYAYHWLKIKEDFLQSRIRGGAIKRLSRDDVENLLIPIPVLGRQQEIVSTLDTFESLISNIKQELDARKKQYEYYREKLLTFE